MLLADGCKIVTCCCYFVIIDSKSVILTLTYHNHHLLNPENILIWAQAIPGLSNVAPEATLDWTSFNAPRITWRVSSHAAPDAAARSHCWNRCTGFPFVNSASTSWYTLTYKVQSTVTPAYLHSLLIPRAPARSLRSGSAKRLIVPRTRTRTVIGSRAFSIAAPTVWNALPDNVVNAASLTIFKKTFEDSSV